MKKLLFLTLAMIIGFSKTADAANYNYYNHNQFVANYKERQKYEFKKFSLGADYVMGKLDFTDKSIDIENPLFSSDEGLYSAKASNFDDSLDAMSVNFGYRPWRYLGFELFYQQALSSKGVTRQEHYAGRNRFGLTEYELDYKAYGIDAIAFLPLAERLELIVTAGYAQYSFDAKFDINAYQLSTAAFVKGNSADFSEDIGSFRAGLGLQLRLTDRLSFRAMYRYIPLGGEYIDILNEISAGVRYSF